MSALQFPDTETPLPALEGDQGLQVVVLPEVGPQRVRVEELRVCNTRVLTTLIKIN